MEGLMSMLSGGRLDTSVSSILLVFCKRERKLFAPLSVVELMSTLFLPILLLRSNVICHLLQGQNISHACISVCVSITS